MSDCIPLASLCEFIVDCEHRTAPLASDGYPSIRTPNVGKGRLILDGVNRVSPDTYKLWTRRAVPRKADLIIAREAPVGNVAIIPAGLEVCLGQRTVLVRPNAEKVIPAYLCYFLLGDYAQGRFRATSSGATVAHLNMKDIRNLPVPKLPALNVQRRIASILEAYDDLIEVNRRRVAVLEEMARGLFEEWFVRFRFPGYESVQMVDTPDGPLPAGWSHGTLGDLVEQRRDTARPGAHLAERRYVPIECIGRRSLALSEHQSWENAQSSLQLFEEGDILFGAMRAYFHKVAPAPFAGITRSTCFVLRPRSYRLASYALMTLFRDATVAFAAAKSSGSTIPYAQWRGVLEAMPAPVPDERLLSRFDAVVRPMVRSIMCLTGANERLAASRDLLLPRIVSGQLSVKAAERLLVKAA